MAPIDVEIERTIRAPIDQVFTVDALKASFERSATAG